jgi:ATP-dependent DNA ligase
MKPTGRPARRRETWRCLVRSVLVDPKPSARLRAGLWLHEIKHDGFRVIARKDGAKVRLYSRPGNDLTYRFPLIVESLARLRSRSCIIDGEAVSCDESGVRASSASVTAGTTPACSSMRST